MASRALADLTPQAHALALAFLAEYQARGLPVLIYCTLRSHAEQAQLYAQGRSRPGPILTNAQPGQSRHNPNAHGQASAFDAVPVRDGQALWDNAAAIELMGTCGEAVGLQWAGRWRGALRERLHFQTKEPA